MSALEHAAVLTGGIATGKSTVCNFMKMLGLRIIDADTIAHAKIEENREQIAKLFGRRYVTEKGVDRKALGQLIFANPVQKEKLEHLLHPQIKQAIYEEADRLEQLGGRYLIDIPLFFETANYDLHPIVVVYAPKPKQLRRLMERESLTRDEALRRIGSQIDIERKKSAADIVIDNSGDLKYLQAECETALHRLVKGF